MRQGLGWETWEDVAAQVGKTVSEILEEAAR